MKTLAQLRELSVADLKKEIKTLQFDIYNHSIKVNTGSSADTGTLSTLKQQIARCKTVMTEKEVTNSVFA